MDHPGEHPPPESTAQRHPIPRRTGTPGSASTPADHSPAPASILGSDRDPTGRRNYRYQHQPPRSGQRVSPPASPAELDAHYVSAETRTNTAGNRPPRSAPEQS